jgi:CHAT domain-containing protein
MEMKITRASHEIKASDREMLKRKIFVITVIKETGKIKISGYEKLSDEQKTMLRYEELQIEEEKIHQYKAEIIDLLNRASKRGHVNGDILNKLKTTGQFLYDELFSIEIKRKLSGTAAGDLIISIDDNLVDIPWELLYDGKSFLCLRFNIGRLVRTRQSISETSSRNIKLPLKMLILSNPQGNLKSAYLEGFSIRDELEYLDNTVHINVKSNDITSNFVKSNIRNFDIVHYSGHADYDSSTPSESGFLLEDGKLKASDIINLIGTVPFPSLVFSNACKSGHTDKWAVGEHYGKEIYGLANAFLLAGVNHYIGTFWDVQDEPGLHFALAFYNELMQGAMIGEAVRAARLELIRRYGEDTIIWASYMLYGDPSFKYVGLKRSEAHNAETLKYQGTVREQVEALSGNTRSIEATAEFNSKKRTWILIGAGLLLILGVLGVFYIGKPRMNIPVRQVEVPVAEILKDEKIDALVASLIRAYEERQKKGVTHIASASLKAQPAMVFLNIKNYGVNDADKEYILAKVADILQSTKKMQVVEREVLDKLLQELKLSSSQLADPANALKVGKILSAGIISTGSIVRDGNEWQISLRLIETETTSVKAAITETVITKEKDVVAENLSNEILKKVLAEYP